MVAAYQPRKSVGRNVRQRISPMWLETGSRVEGTAVRADTLSTFSPDRLRLKVPALNLITTHPPALCNHKSDPRIQIYRQDSRPGDQKYTSHTLNQVIYGLLHEQRIRHIRRDRAEQDRSQRLPWNCWRPVENRVQLRKLGLATGGWPTVRGGRKVGCEDRRGLITVTTW
jgi:hypothetical protein